VLLAPWVIALTDKPHDRRISFRVTHEDFEQMLRVRNARGASTVSELARAAIQAFIRSSGQDTEQGALRAIIEDLRLTIEELKLRLDGLNTPLVRSSGEKSTRNNTDGCNPGADQDEMQSD